MESHACNTCPILMGIETVQHIIDTGGKEQELTFSIDFEPIKMFVSKKIVDEISKTDINYFETTGKHFWQQIISFCCDVLGKEKREIFAYREFEPLPKFSKTVLEFVSYGGYQWRYFQKTKTHHFNKWYYWYNTFAYKDGREFNERYEEYRHYHFVYDYLRRQGLVANQNYNEPTNTMIDKLIKNLIR